MRILVDFGKDPYTVKAKWTKLEEPIKFLCLFVPIQTTTQEGQYNFSEAEVVECKIRGAGHYFKIEILEVYK
jgi:hypothetical protein